MGQVMRRTKYPAQDKQVQFTTRQLKTMLTEKQKHFCHEYCSNGWNGTQAAISARYSRHTASQIAIEILRKPWIRQYIQAIKTDYELLCGISKSKVIREYSKIAFSSIRNIHNSWVALTDYKTLVASSPEVLDAVESIETKVEQRIVDKELVEVKFVKVKLYSKISALDSINKILGYNEPDKVVSTTDTTLRLQGTTIQDLRTAFGLDDLENPMQ